MLESLMQMWSGSVLMLYSNLICIKQIRICVEKSTMLKKQWNKKVNQRWISGVGQGLTLA